jgi:NAD(P)-dependent dehydrogenase (short-subunit alcohol dehydrogenase family)
MAKDEGRLSRRRVLVIGASQGIGRAIAMRCASEGASVALAARSAELLSQAAAECSASSPDGSAKSLALPCDVRQPDACRAAVDAAAAYLGGLDALVYATGMTRFVQLADATAEQWREVLETNLVGASLMTSAAVPYLRESRGQAIYLSSESVSERPTWTGIGLYTASKCGLESIARTYQSEVPEVAFTTYVVGATAGTDFASDQAADMTPFVTDWLSRGVQFGTLLSPEIHAQAIANLLALDAWVERISVRGRRA